MNKLLSQLALFILALAALAFLLYRITPLDGRLDAVGFNLNDHLQNGIATSAFDTAAGLGLRWVRIEVPWNEVETAPGAYSWVSASTETNRDLDQLVNQATLKGLNIVMVLEGGPVYLSQRLPDSPVNSDELLTRWNLFLQVVVQRYGAKVHAWQIGKDLNTYQGWGSVLFPAYSGAAATPDPILYGRMLQTAYSVFKQNNPGDEIILGGLSFTGNGDCGVSPYSYLIKLQTAGAWGNFDVVAMNEWWGSVPPEQISQRGVSFSPLDNSCISGQVMQTDMINEVRTFRSLVQQLGGKPLWVTGIGMDEDSLQNLAFISGLEPAAAEAAYLSRLMVPILAEPGIERVFWTSLPVSAQNSGLPASPEAQAAISNLAALTTGSLTQGQVQGQAAGSTLLEYRFEKDGQTISFAWHANGASSGSPVQISLPNGFSVRSAQVDVANLESVASSVKTDATGTTLTQIDELPQVVLAQPSDLIGQVTAAVSDRLSAWQDGLNAISRQWVEQAKVSASNTVTAWLRQLVQQTVGAMFNQINQGVNQMLGVSPTPSGG